MLARREHTEMELVRKLRARKFSSDDIQSVIKALAQENLLSHLRFIESYLHQRRIKGFGPLRIRAELIERGIDEELIEHHIKIADNAWFAEAYAAWQKRFKSRVPTDLKSRAQMMRFLQYRGFTSEQIEWVLRDALRAPQDERESEQ